jgi:hypothetical protein
LPGDDSATPGDRQGRVPEEELLYETEGAQALRAQATKQAADSQAAANAQQRGIKELWLGFVKGDGNLPRRRTMLDEFKNPPSRGVRNQFI